MADAVKQEAARDGAKELSCKSPRKLSTKRAGDPHLSSRSEEKDVQEVSGGRVATVSNAE